MLIKLSLLFLLDIGLRDLSIESDDCKKDGFAASYDNYEEIDSDVDKPSWEEKPQETTVLPFETTQGCVKYEHIVPFSPYFRFFNFCRTGNNYIRRGI